jgi:hypothetical protein
MVIKSGDILLLVTCMGEYLGDESFLLHLISITVVIAVLIPIKNWLERILEGCFAKKRFEF